MSSMEIVLRFDSGTLLLDKAERSFPVPQAFRWDERVMRWRAPAWAYRHVVKDLIRQGTVYEDQARAYQEFDFPATLAIEPRPYQHQSMSGDERRAAA